MNGLTGEDEDEDEDGGDDEFIGTLGSLDRGGLVDEGVDGEE